jgi:peptidoglycan/xylan/chitin deacetylase (PgdA/CDA1 family)
MKNIVASRAGRTPAMILMYHRVADDLATPWTTSNRIFERQIRWLRGNFELVSLDEVRERIKSPKNHRPCIAITFDDGYAENCESALPLLIKDRIPCTYFVTTKYALEGKLFPHDLALGHTHCRPNTVEQLRMLSDSGIEIGGHTRTHADLGKIADPDKLRDEIVGGARDMEDAIGRPIRYFAFPFGQHANLNAEAFRIARSAGFKAVVSAYGGFNFPGDDPFHLQRIGADGNMIRLKNWVTVDPRKIWITKRFEYKLGLDRLAKSAGNSDREYAETT